MTQIVIAEDEARIADFIAKGLQAHGMSTTVVATAREAYEHVMSGSVDLLLLDLGLEDGDGTVALRQLRAAGSAVPVIILTARSSVADTVAGLDGGADDYMAKPFRFEELLARIRLRLRTAVGLAPGEQSTLTHGRLTLDLHTRRMQVGAREVELSAREFSLAEAFMRHPEHVLSREQLLSQVWGYDFDPGSNVVDVYVRYLRRKIGAEHIATLRGMGYRLVAAPEGDPQGE
ncbi:response regulator transcription factor [Pengzhenrongella sicca]|uniref:Response regulator transcription factor n=1 Tax=Pengzhenrongella sicca TaxID=2819238 RepID=A0A8A4ZDW6_9MICO|nr:response regulator transcription factor [Pengzhenrongella sicca]QTE29103.1 response regulator transcription factor [Pengzhenrongella sicca]